MKAFFILILILLFLDIVDNWRIIVRGIYPYAVNSSADEELFALVSRILIFGWGVYLLVR